MKGDRMRRETRAYSAGYNAAKAEKSMQDCPYNIGSPRSNDWARGYWAAQREARELKGEQK